MFKRSASRTQRSKGVVRAKQILQILLLLGICFWLVYQLKYSHDKKKVMIDEKDVSRISHNVQDDNLDLKFGRKELHPRYDKQHKEESEEQEQENKVEDEDEGNKMVEDEDEGNKMVEDDHEEVGERDEVEENSVGGVQVEDDLKKAHEEVESEEDVREEEEEEMKNDEPRQLEVEEEEEEEGMKELEDREKERPQDDEGDDRGEEFIEEEKEKEEELDENIEEVKIEQVEDETEGNTSVEDEDEASRAAHEAREEHYKGDDASSAVETKELDKSSVPNNDSGTVEIIEMSSGSKSLNGTSSADAKTTELANSSPTDETVMENATVVNSNANLTEAKEALTYQPTSDSELLELSSTHSEDSSLVGSDSNLRLPSNTTKSRETNTQDEDPGGHNEAGVVETA